MRNGKIFLVIKTGAQAVDGCQARAFREMKDAKAFMRAETRHLLAGLAGTDDPGRIELVAEEYESILLQNGEETRWAVREVALSEEKGKPEAPDISMGDQDKAAALLLLTPEIGWPDFGTYQE